MVAWSRPTWQQATTTLEKRTKFEPWRILHNFIIWLFHLEEVEYRKPWPIAIFIPKITKSKGPGILNICRKWGTYGRKTWSWWLQNNFLAIAPFMVQNQPNTTEQYNIQLVPIIWNTSFYQPVQISVDSLAAVASFQLVPKYISKVEVISKYFTIFPIVQWRMWFHFLLLVDVVLLNLAHCYSGHVQVCKSVWKESFICSFCPLCGGICTW